MVKQRVESVDMFPIEQFPDLGRPGGWAPEILPAIPLPPTDFFDQKRPWSHWKHEVLRCYLPRFAHILGRWHPTVYYVDGFAGEGTYKSDDEPGSPLIAAEFSSRLFASGKWGFSLICINVEKNKRHHQKLLENTSEYDQRLIRNLGGEFRKHLPRILDSVGHCPTIFFLDPYGYKGMEWDIVSQIAQRTRRAKTELIINFNVLELYRDAGFLRSDHHSAPRFIKSLGEFFGTCEWQACINWSSKEESYESLTNLYINRLEKQFGVHVARYAIRKIEGELKYYLLYVTRNLRGSREMSDVIYKVEDEYRSEQNALVVPASQGTEEVAQAPLLFEEFVEEATEEVAAPLSEEELVSKLAIDVFRLGSDQGTIKFGAIRDQLSVPWFGLVTERHYRKACRELEAEGRMAKVKRIDDGTMLTFVR